MRYKSKNLVARLTEEQLAILNSRFSLKVSSLTPEEAIRYSFSKFILDELNLPK